MDNVFRMASEAEIRDSVDTIRLQTDTHGFSIIRGVVGPSAVNRLRARLREMFDPSEDVRISGNYKRGCTDFQRLDLGEYPGSTRFARYFFLFPWNNDEVFTDVSRVQLNIFNRLAQKPGHFGSMTPDDPHPDRFHVSFAIQYPIGGGFMSRHREHTREERDKAYVVYLALTTRGQDFRTGGAYVFRDDEKIEIEQWVQAGDVLIYRGDQYHGVEGIDRDQPVDLSRLCGRLILTTVIKYFEVGAPQSPCQSPCQSP